MKKSAVFVSIALLFAVSAFAGGILTNTNQSAQFTRILSRNASTDLDAVYFNPAGLTQLKNGFYFGLHNQTISQNKFINSEFPYLNNADYKGVVKAPVFPTAFAVYKLDNWAFSAGFGPNGGGGSAKFDKGLPSFEKQISSLVPSLAGLSALGVAPPNAYAVDIQFEGTSVFWGIQVGATYKISDVLSVYGGARYLPSVNTYNGSIKNIQIGTGGTFENAQTYLTGKATIASTISAQTAFGASSLQTLVSLGAGSLTFAQAQNLGLTATQRAQLEGGLRQLGLTQAQIDGMSLSTAQSTYTGASVAAAATASKLNGTAAGLADKSVDAKQTGAGFTPIIGFDIHLDKLNIGLKYEHQTTLVLTNATKVDELGLFPDGGKSGSDLPGIIAGGADYKVTDNLKVTGSFDLYLDKGVGWGNNVYGQHRSIDKNYLELAFGAEYKLNKNFAISAGYLNSNMGVSEAYQSDFSYSNDSYTLGGGFQWNINKKLVFDAGVMMTTYKDFTKNFDSNGNFDATNAALITNFGPYKETYGKDTFTIAFGIGYKIF